MLFSVNIHVNETKQFTQRKRTSAAVQSTAAQRTGVESIVFSWLPHTGYVVQRIKTYYNSNY